MVLEQARGKGTILKKSNAGVNEQMDREMNE